MHNDWQIFATISNILNNKYKIQIFFSFNLRLLSVFEHESKWKIKREEVAKVFVSTIQKKKKNRFFCEVPGANESLWMTFKKLNNNKTIYKEK